MNEKKKIKNKEKYYCNCCNVTSTICNKNRHLHSVKHVENMSKYYEDTMTLIKKFEELHKNIMVEMDNIFNSLPSSLACNTV